MDFDDNIQILKYKIKFFLYFFYDWTIFLSLHLQPPPTIPIKEVVLQVTPSGLNCAIGSHSINQLYRKVFQIFPITIFIFETASFWHQIGISLTTSYYILIFLLWIKFLPLLNCYCNQILHRRMKPNKLVRYRCHQQANTRSRTFQRARLQLHIIFRSVFDCFIPW